MTSETKSKLEVRRAGLAEEDMAHYGRKAVRHLLPLCQDRDPNTRFRAIYSLGFIGDPRGFDAIVKGCFDREEFIRYESRYALGHLKHGRSGYLLAKWDQNGQSEDSATAQGLALMCRQALLPLNILSASNKVGAIRTVASVVRAFSQQLAMSYYKKLYESERRDLREIAVDEAGCIEGMNVRLREFFQRASQDPDEDVRFSASRWLEALDNDDERFKPTRRKKGMAV